MTDFGNLETLYMGFTHVSHRGLAYVAKHPKVRYLNLYGCPKVDDRAIGVLSSMKNLEQLSLYGTDVTDGAITSLARMPNLKQVNLTATLMSVDGIQRLKRLSPDLQVDCEVTRHPIRPVTSARYPRTKRNAAPKVREPRTRN